MCDSLFARNYIDLRVSAAIDELPIADPTRAQLEAYEDATGVAAWQAIIDDPAYRIYGDCRAAVAAHLASSEWHDLQRRQPFTAAVDLGPGDGEKLCQMLPSLQKHGVSTILLCDISTAMLRCAFANVIGVGKSLPAPITILPIRLNFAQTLTALRDEPKLRSAFSEQDRLIYFLLGCTFGNHDERELRDQLARSLRAGDAIVLGIGLYELDDGQRCEGAALLGPYQCPAFHHWANGAAPASGNPQTDDHDTLRVRIEKYAPHSDVADAWSILTEVSVQGERKPIVRSNRYALAAFIDFFEQGDDFALSYRMPSPLNPFYQHFVFTRR